MERVIADLFFLKNSMHIFHWQTRSFAKHSAADFFNDNFSKILDSMVESYLGRGKKLSFPSSVSIPLTNVNESMILSLLESSCNLLESSHFEEDVNNIKEELISLINQTRYKLSLS